MLLSRIFEHLNYGELSQLSVGTADSGAIATTDYPKLISYINLGLLELYKRFPVLEKEVTVTEYDAITVYPLLFKYAVSNTESGEDPKFIADTAESPFLADVLKIEQVFNELGEEIPLNDAEDDDSYFTPYVTTLQIPFPVEGNSTSVLYRAAPVPIVAEGVDPTTEEVVLPEQLLEALLYYVASRTHSGILSGSPTDNSFMTKFENSCARVLGYGLLQIENNSSSKPESAGWA